MAGDSTELVINAGDALQLQFYPGKNHDERYYVRIIGYLEGKSIITTIPVVNKKYMLVKEGQQFAVRLMSGNSIQAFLCTAIKNASIPYPYMHLSYPDDLESKVVRKAQRVTTKSIATVQNQETDKKDVQTKSAIICDISTGGALLITPLPIGDVGDMVTITTRIKVAEVDEYINISAIIRRNIDPEVDENDENKITYRCGVEFQIIDDRDKLIIHGYVYEQIAKSLDS